MAAARLMSALRSILSGPAPEAGGQAPGRGSALLADFLEARAKPKALDPGFDALLGMRLGWEIAPDGVLECLPLDPDQREQYDFVAVCEQSGRTLHLLDSRPVWAPGIPYVPSFLLAEVSNDLSSMRPIGTFDRKPEAWTFAWQAEPGAGREGRGG